MISIQNYPCGHAGKRAGKLPYLFLLMAMQRHMEHSTLKARHSCFLYNMKPVYNAHRQKNNLIFGFKAFAKTGIWHLLAFFGV